MGDTLIRINAVVPRCGDTSRDQSGNRDTAVDDKAFLLEQAARFRRLARDVLDLEAEFVLLGLAVECEESAAAIPDSTAGATSICPP